MLIDDQVLQALADAIPTPVVVALIVLSFLGSIYLIAPATVAGYLVADGRRTASWIAIMVGAYALMTALKPLFAVPRPAVDPNVSAAALPAILEPMYESAAVRTTESFPSGHALAGTVFWGLLAVDLRIGRLRQRIVAAVGVIGLVGFIRVALGAHYPTDVVVGALIGAAFLAAMVYLRDRAEASVSTLFAVAIGLSLLALVGDRGAEAVDLLGVAVGALVAWVALQRIDADAALGQVRSPTVHSAWMGPAMVLGAAGATAVTGHFSVGLFVAVAVGAAIVVLPPATRSVARNRLVTP